MLATFLTVGQQVLVLFLIMGVGILCNKRHLFGETAVKGMTNLVLYFVTPCVIIQSFQRPFERGLIKGLLITALVAAVSMVFSIFLGKWILHDGDSKREIVYRFAVIFSNCGFMSLPIMQAIRGADGVFYGAMFIAVFNIILWTYGLFAMSAGRNRSP